MLRDAGPRRAHIRRNAIERRTRTVVCVAVVTAALHVAIDAALGRRAEYFNAWRMLAHLDPGHDGAGFITGQHHLGPAAPFLALVAFGTVHLAIATIAVAAVRSRACRALIRG
jgi:hypothetical protein